MKLVSFELSVRVSPAPVYSQFLLFLTPPSAPPLHSEGNNLHPADGCM